MHLQNILIVDGEPVISELWAEQLSNLGYHVDTAKDGSDAWRALQSKNYDLLVTDSLMPKVSGIELLKKLLEARVNLPVVMSTAIPLANAYTYSPLFHSTIVILKPHDFEKLLKAIKQHFPTTF